MEPSRIFADSHWIWPDSLHWDIHNSYALFRKSFSLRKLPAKAPLFITADQSYQLYLNGRYVNRGPARGFQHRWPYDEVDVRPYLRKGRNVLAVRAHNPGFSNFQYLTQGYAGLLVAAKWGTFRLVTDATWKARRQTGINVAAVPTSLQLFSQEHIDLRIEDPAWMEPDFDDSDWKSKLAQARWNAMPWYSLEERQVPLLEEKIIFPVARLGSATGANDRDVAAPRNVSLPFFAEGLAHQPASGAGEELAFPGTGPGKFHRFLLDFGHTVVGSLGLEIQGAQGGEIIDTLHVETIDAATLTADFVPEAHCRMAFSHRLVCRPGDQTHFFYHPFGFRYLVIAVRDSASTLTVRPSLRTTLYPLKIEGSFRSSDENLNQIWEISAWTQRCCSLDTYVDTPWREQAQWWGDARVQAWNTFYLANDDRLLRRGIHSLSQQRVPNGLTYGHAPTMAHNCILPDFSLTWLLTLWDHYWQTGSTEACAQNEEAIADVLRYFRGNLHPRLHLAQYDPRYWLFLDWTDLYREGCPTILNLWLLLALERLADLRVVMKQKREAAALRKWAAELRRALGRLFDRSGLLRDGCDVHGKPIAKTSVHAQTLAILAGLRPASTTAMLDRVIRPFIRGEKTFQARPSSYWVTYVFTVLQEHGNAADVLAYLRKYWTPMVPHGTTWENYAPRRGDESFSHAWSAHPVYHLMQILGGVKQEAPAWRKIAYEPCFEGDSADVVIPTPQGKIRSAWTRDGSKIHARLDLPKGVSATVRLPGRKAFTAQGRSNWTISSTPD
jgi:alpha-L-rhamnosidase